MRDVRDELRNLLVRERVRDDGSPRGSYMLADAILARWDLTEKPVVSDQELGVMVADAHCGGVGYFAEQGASLREALGAKGLTIVRSGEAK